MIMVCLSVRIAYSKPPCPNYSPMFRIISHITIPIRVHTHPFPSSARHQHSISYSSAAIAIARPPAAPTPWATNGVAPAPVAADADDDGVVAALAELAELAPELVPVAAAAVVLAPETALLAMELVMVAEEPAEAAEDPEPAAPPRPVGCSPGAQEAAEGMAACLCEVRLERVEQGEKEDAPLADGTGESQRSCVGVVSEHSKMEG